MLKPLVKKILALFLVAAVALYTTIPVSATNTTRTTSASDLSQSALFDVLHYVETQKAQFGLENVNFSTLSIGNPIQTYEYTSTGLQQLQPIYPILDGNKIVMIAQNTADGNCQISTGLANKLNDSYPNSIAVIYDCDGAYLFDGTIFTQIYENTEAIQSREALSDLTSSDNVDSFSLDSEVTMFNSNTITLTDLNDASPLNYASSSNRSVIYSCDVDFVLQETGNTCWAACVACISNYVRNTSYSSANVVTMVQRLGNNIPSGEDFTRELSDVAGYMRLFFDLQKYAYCTDPFSTGFAVASLSNDRPAILNFYPVNDMSATKHAVVVSAINVTSSYLTLMDPMYGFITASHNGSYFTYTSPTTSNTMRTGTFIYYDEDFTG